VKAAVVGAGIAGLTAAWELARAGIEVVVLESERRAGGVIVTERRDGFLVEGGPDGWLAAERDIPDLAAELGVANGVVRQSARGSWLWPGGGSALERLDEGRAATLLGIQTQGADLTAGFQSFAEGMERIVAALLDQIGSTVRSPLGVTGLTADHGHWRLTVTGGMTVEADGIVLALPAFSAGRLLEQAGVTGARELGEVTYFPSVTTSLAYEQSQIGRPLEGTGFVTSAGAAGVVRACTYVSQKFPGRAPAGHVLLRAFVGPTDGDPGQAAHRELAAALQIRGGPMWSRAFFWTKGIPRYTAHHATHVAEVRRRLDALTPVAIAGAGYDGAGVSACVRSGRAAGREIVRRLSAA
jgi:protoporphyrinogen oxidase